MTWDAADQFIANMNAFNGVGYLGQKGGKLSPLDDCTAYNCASVTSPLAQLYVQLGLTSGMPAATAPNVDVGPFNNMQPYLYWACGANSIQENCNVIPAPNFEWSFSFGNGFQGTDILSNDLYVTAYSVGPAR